MSELMPTYGLLVINHAYNQGLLSFQEWRELSRQWAEAMQARYRQGGTTGPARPNRQHEQASAAN
jgi:hypothetical protein